MNVKNITKALRLCHKVQTPCMLWGDAGEAKTETVRLYAKQHDMLLVEVRVGEISDPGDLIGLPKIVSVGNSKAIKDMSTLYVRPHIWPRENDVKNYNGLLIFLDELNRMNHDVKQGIFQLIFEKRIMNHDMPKDTFVVAAGNYNTTEYDTSDISDKALHTRLVHYNVEIDPDEWLTWAIQDGNIDEDVVQFLAANPSDIRESDYRSSYAKGKEASTKKSDKKVEGIRTPRTWEIASKIRKAALGIAPYEKEDGLPEFWDNHGSEIVAGAIGVSGAARFMMWAKQKAHRPLSGDEVLGDYSEHRNHMKELIMSQTGEVHSSAIHATTVMVLSTINRYWGKTKSADTKSIYGIDEATVMENFAQWFIDLPDDYRNAFLIELGSSQPNKNQTSFNRAIGNIAAKSKSPIIGKLTEKIFSISKIANDIRELDI